MAINSQSDIVPVIITGTYESLPYKSLYVKPADIKFKLLPAISTQGMTYDHRGEPVGQLRSTAEENRLA